MLKVSLYGHSEPQNLLLSDWLTEKVQRGNFALTDFMRRSIGANGRMQSVFSLSLDNVATFDEHIGAKATLMNMPFLALSPVLDDPRDWESFVDGVMHSPKVESLIAAMPRLARSPAVTSTTTTCRTCNC
ncbi:hypothetical protein [Paraburkholderia sp. RL17-337-BIB-A]|uniref:hypothetical protein n=1 Tax=Paraburkholderia sp. RL17-337-BIB-A TaxID=3031636 RepID=UPI0038BBDBCC